MKLTDSLYAEEIYKGACLGRSFEVFLSVVIG